MDALKNDYFTKLHKLESYAYEGKWQNVLEFAGHFKAAAAAAAAQDTVAKEQAISLTSSTELQAILQEEFHAELAFSTFKVQALMRLGKFTAAADELASLGDLPDRQLAGASRPCIPFGLLYLRAQLPACSGAGHTTLDLLHELRGYCQLQLQQASVQQQQQAMLQQPQQLFNKMDMTQGSLQQQVDVEDVKNPDQDSAQQQQQQLQEQQQRQQTRSTGAVALWQHRLQGVTCSLISHYWQQGSVTTAFQLLDQLLLLSPADIRAWSAAGRLQLQMNLMPLAHRSFTKVQQLVQQQGEPQQQSRNWLKQQQLVHHNWGCYHAMAGNMTGALAEFHAAQELATNMADTAATAAPLHAAAPAGDMDVADSTDLDAAVGMAAFDAVSVSNYAVCLLHMGQLTEAISALEAAVQQHPAMLVHGCAVYNLGLMYDLAYRDATAKQARHQLATAALRLLPDDFDLSYIEGSKDSA